MASSSSSLSKPPKKSKSSSEVFIPDPLVMDIMGRLPVKSLARFKCLSKFWLSYIEDPSFIDKTRLKAPFIWLFKDTCDEETFSLYSVDSDGPAAVVHTYKFEERIEHFRHCDGLLCFVSDDYGLCLYNLTTKVGAQLPDWSGDFELVFDPRSNKYKVLGWKKRQGENVLDIKILTLEKGLSWRPVRNTLGLTSLSDDADATVDGKLFWYVKRRILSFNLASEEFSEFGLPDESDKFCDYSIFRFDDSLALAEQRKEASISFWILSDAGVWKVMKRNVRLPFEGTPMVAYYSETDSEWKLSDSYFSSRSGEILITVSDNEDEGNLYLYSYHPLNGEIKMMTIGELPYYNFSMSNYVDNSLCLHELV